VTVDKYSTVAVAHSIRTTEKTCLSIAAETGILCVNALPDGGVRRTKRCCVDGRTLLHAVRLRVWSQSVMTAKRV